MKRIFDLNISLLSRVQSATIKWSYPYNFDSALEKEICYEGYGVYCISRIFGTKETILYIGKTSCNFQSRLKDHYWKWIDNYKGVKRVRFGTVISPLKHTEDLINDLEGALIYELDPIHNICRKFSYSYLNQYKIKNVGYRGEIPALINMKEH